MAEQRRLQFYHADVFTDEPFGGNPVAVFPDADGLTDVELQQIAREMNLSETVFVFPPTDKAAVVKMRIFTPTQEIPFAGHPVIGTFFVLGTLKRLSLKEPVTTGASGMQPRTVPRRHPFQRRRDRAGGDVATKPTIFGCDR